MRPACTSLPSTSLAAAWPRMTASFRRIAVALDVGHGERLVAGDGGHGGVLRLEIRISRTDVGHLPERGAIYGPPGRRPPRDCRAICPPIMSEAMRWSASVAPGAERAAKKAFHLTHRLRSATWADRVLDRVGFGALVMFVWPVRLQTGGGCRSARDSRKRAGADCRAWCRRPGISRPAYAPGRRGTSVALVARKGAVVGNWPPPAAAARAALGRPGPCLGDFYPHSAQTERWQTEGPLTQ